jgi:hypothetical protein
MRVRDAQAQPHESGDRPAAVPRPGAVADLKCGCGLRLGRAALGSDGARSGLASVAALTSRSLDDLSWWKYWMGVFVLASQFLSFFFSLL